MLILPESIKTLINAFMAIFAKKEDLKQSDWNQADTNKLDFIKNKPAIATDEEIINLVAAEDMLPTVVDSDGAILSDENKNILLW